MLTKVTGATQVFSVTSSTVSTSTAFTGYPKVRIATTVPVLVELGATPVASTTTSMLLPANAVEHFSISKGASYTDVSTTVTTVVSVDGYKVSLRALNTAGTVTVTPVA